MRSGGIRFSPSMFGGEDAFGSAFGGGGDGHHGMYGGGGRAVKAAPIERKLPCSLEELYKGTTKKMKISREIADASG
jgi:DnaJ family protein B protein 4